MTRSHSVLPGWRRLAGGAAALAVLLGAADVWVGQQQRQWLEGRKAYRKKLDQLAFHALRTGIDAISFDERLGYRVTVRVQNALDEPIYVMLPEVSAYVQVGPGWTQIPVAFPPAGSDEGNVVRLTGERTVERYLPSELPEYTELIPGYVHLKLALEAYVSPEANPREEVGERKEDLVVYLKDHRLAGDAVRHAGRPSFVEKPDFIPLRAWTLVPKPVK